MLGSGPFDDAARTTPSWGTGLTTVFCNAVNPTGGVKGGSCFVGYGGWHREATAPELPTSGPYHGAVPGVFRAGEHPSGELGEREEALVIADIDVVSPMAGKPRPQALPEPLRLVAHLPIFDAPPGPRDSEAGPSRCHEETWASRLHDAMRAFEFRRGPRSAGAWTPGHDTDAVAAMRDALNELAKRWTRTKLSAGKSREPEECTLQWRAACWWDRHRLDARDGIPSAALDWIYVGPDAYAEHESAAMELREYRRRCRQ